MEGLLVLVPIIAGILPAAVAHQKGRGFGIWWLYGTLLFPIALPHALVLAPDLAVLDRRRLDAGMKRCPDCAELIRGQAKVCRYCRADIGAVSADGAAPVTASSAKGRTGDAHDEALRGLIASGRLGTSGTMRRPPSQP